MSTLENPRELEALRHNAEVRLQAIGEKLKQCEYPDVLARMEKELAEIEAQLSPKTQAFETPAEVTKEKEFMPPVRSAADLLKENSDPNDWVMIGDMIIAIPFPKENPKGYYIVLDPRGDQSGDSIGLLVKFYPEAQQGIKRGQYEFTEAAWAPIEILDGFMAKVRPNELGKFKEFRIMDTLDAFSLSYCKSGKVRKK